MQKRRFDLVILGSGSTAFAATIRAAELGKTAAMTENRTLGGTCVNRGWLPWIVGINQNSTITIAVKEPEVEHRVRIRDFENWLSSNGKSPAEQALKIDLRALLNAAIGEKPARRR
jgi:pyruvate/2-oxoglutarate dehydrogenase complex dihydrolipoamide dehydrogenase (E3) component